MTRIPVPHTLDCWRSALLIATVGVTSVVASLATPVLAGSALATTVAPPTNSGKVVPIDINDRTKELTNGKSSTQFILKLPDGAACPGDSAHDQWRVQSYIVPIGDEPGTLSYGVIGPEGTSQFALYFVNSEPLVNNLLPQNASAGKPAVIAPIEALSFAVFPPGTLPAGRYHMGIACTLFRQTANYWDTEIVLTASPNDKPGQLTWRLADAPEVAPSTNDNSNVLVASGIGALVVLAVIAVFALRAKQGRTTPLKDTTPLKEMP